MFDDPWGTAAFVYLLLGLLFVAAGYDRSQRDPDGRRFRQSIVDVHPALWVAVLVLTVLLWLPAVLAVALFARPPGRH